MKFNYKKLASVLTSVVMIGSTVGLAAAANYPAPFVKGGVADVAVVYGSGAALTDVAAVADITSNLQSELAKQTAVTSSTGASASVSGEASPLFTGSSKIYINDTLNVVKSALTKTELPTVLKDGSFSGNVDATYTQTITLGSAPIVTFAKAPTSDVDPQYALSFPSGTLYNASVTFNKAVAINSTDSKGQDLTLFGQKFTVASSTDATSLVLFKSAQKIDLSSDAPTTKVTIEGTDYTVELVSASSSSATVKVTNEKTGTSESKEISEGSSKKVQGLSIAVINADSNNFKLTASIIAGAQKVTLQNNTNVQIGDDNTAVDGTNVLFSGNLGALTKIDIAVSAPNSDKDAIMPGQSVVDPVFGSFKIDFPAMSVDMNSTARENIVINSIADDKEGITFTDYRGNTKTVQFAKNNTGSTDLQIDNDGRNMTVVEGQATYRNEYIVVGNEAEGYLLKVSQISNQSTDYSSDKVRFTDIFSGDTYDATLTAEGSGTVTIGGKVYTVTYSGASTISEDARTVTLAYPDSTGNDLIIFPAISTSKGAKIEFTEPTTLALTSVSGSNIKVPNGNKGYKDIAVARGNGDSWTIGGVAFNATTGLTAGISSAAVAIGDGLTLNFTNTATANQTKIYLIDPAAGTNIVLPAVAILEEKDDNSNYNALVATISAGDGTSTTPIQVNDIARSWLPSVTSGITKLRDSLASNSKITKQADLYGTIVTLDQTDSKRKFATISYPDEQPYAMIYMGENSAMVSAEGATGSTGSVKVLGSVAVKDSEVASVAGKNLIVVGGSCVNSVAAELLGGALCGADFEAKTKVGAGSFLIKTYSRSGDKVATLVAGYNAGDTTNAAKFLTTQVVDTTVDKAYVGTSATSATLMTSVSA